MTAAAPAAFGYLTGNHGEITFDARTGRVEIDDKCGCADCLETDAVHVDVDEWRRTYPGEDVAAGHDVLDFDVWFMRSGVSEVQTHSEEWREDFRSGRAPR